LFVGQNSLSTPHLMRPNSRRACWFLTTSRNTLYGGKISPNGNVRSERGEGSGGRVLLHRYCTSESNQPQLRVWRATIPMAILLIGDGRMYTSFMSVNRTAVTQLIRVIPAMHGTIRVAAIEYVDVGTRVVPKHPRSPRQGKLR